jgi:hypothetical protein
MNQRSNSREYMWEHGPIYVPMIGSVITGYNRFLAVIGYFSKHVTATGCADN